MQSLEGKVICSYYVSILITFTVQIHSKFKTMGITFSSSAAIGGSFTL